MTIETKMTADKLQKAHKAAQSNDMEVITACNDTVKFFKGNFFSVFSANYRAGIVKDLIGIIHYCIFSDGDTEIYNVREHEVSYDEFFNTLKQRGAFTGDAQFTFDVQRFATSNAVDAAIETLPDDMKDEVRDQYAPYKAEFNAAITGIYLDDLSGGDSEAGEIIPAADLLQEVIPLALTDHSEHAYRKNLDGNFSEDKAAFKRLEQLEKRIFAANGHKIGIDNPDYEIDKLTAEYVEAEKISKQRQAELNAAKKAVADAKNHADGKYFALTDLANERADKLREKFLRTVNVVSDMMIRNQDGFETIPYLFTARVEFDTTKEGNNTISIVCDESEGGQFTLGRYKTFKQAENAIDLFAEAVKRGDKKFTFDIQRFATDNNAPRI